MNKIKKAICVLASMAMCLSLFGCNSDDNSKDDKESKVETTEAQTELSTEEITEVQTEAPTELKTNEYIESPYNIYSYFKETCKDIGQYIEYTEETDANKVLGTDGAYIAKLNFSLTSLEGNTIIYPDLGASIEIYKNSSDAENKKKEYDNYSTEELGYIVFVSENVILRTTTEADSDIVKSLQDNLIAFMKKPKSYVEQQENMKNEEVHPFSIPENYKAKCQDMSYSEIARDTNGLKGQYCKFTGQITQVMDGIYLMNVTADEYGFYSDSIMFTYNIGNENRILQDDIVTIWGQSLGLVTYTSVLGADITVPEIEAKYITIENLN